MPLGRHRINRRAFVAGSLGLAAGALPVLKSQADAPTLQMLCWAGLDDSAATQGFRLLTQHIGANDEIFTFLRSGGIGRFDVVTPSDGVVQGLARDGLIQPIDLSKLTNLANLLPQFQSPDWSTLDGQVFALPLSWRTSPMIYGANALTGAPGEWTDILDPTFKGHVVMTDDVISHVMIWNRVLGAENPAMVSKAALDRTIQKLISIKKNIAAAFVGTMIDLTNELASGRSWVSTAGQENVLSLQAAKQANLLIAHPMPGDFSVCDSLSIAAGAPNLETAYAFLDHMISIDAQATLGTHLYRGVVSATAINSLAPEVRALYPYDDLDSVFSTSPFVGFPPLVADAGDIATYVDWVVAWDRVRFTSMKALVPPTPIPTVTPSPAVS